MTLTELRYIVAVAREKHFGRAAESCFVSQPTLSVGVKKLEEELGNVIFERINNEIKITVFGEQIIAQAERILAEAATLKDLAHHYKNPLVGPLRLGAIYTVGPYLFPDLIPQLKKLAPQMPVIIQEDFTENFRHKLRTGNVDVVILSLPFTETGINTLTLYDEPFVVLLPSDHIWHRKKSIAATDLAKQTVLMLGQSHCLRDQILQVCPGCQRSIHEEQYIGSSIETLRYMVVSGLGLTVLPLSAAQTNITASPLITKPFKQPIPCRRIALAWRKSFPRPQVINVLKKAITTCELSKKLKQR